MTQLAKDALFGVELLEGEDQVVVRPSGEVDLSTAGELARAVRTAEARRPGRLVVDFRDLRFMDMSGLHVLEGARERAKADGRGLVLTSVPPWARRLLDLSGSPLQDLAV